MRGKRTPRTAWVVVDLQHAFSNSATRDLAERVAQAVHSAPGPVYALVQTNPLGGPLRRVRRWHGASRPAAQELLPPLGGLQPHVVHKTGYGAATPLPVRTLQGYDSVSVVGADTDACVLATAIALVDHGVNVVVRANLCWSAGGPELHEAALRILSRQLGASRVVSSSE